MSVLVSTRENQSLEAATDRRQDPLMWVSRFLIKANSIWLQRTYGFEGFGKGVSIHYSCDIQRCYSHKIRIEDFVLLDREVWLNVPIAFERSEPTLIIGKGSNIGRRSVISAANQICIQENVLFAPGVFVTDHNHEYMDPNLPIHAQGVRPGGRIVIERNCWLGYGSMVLSGKDELVLGRNSVVGAYAVVTKSHPPFSVLVGNPARVVKQFDTASGQWVKC
jgi:acetyltransferase-like isoleucine patch superfamily enzyme